MAPRGVDWGSIARMAVISGLIAAVVCFFAIPDQRWIAGLLVGIAVLDAFMLGLVLPRMGGGERANTEL